jgi:aspartate aminotransferase
MRQPNGSRPVAVFGRDEAAPMTTTASRSRTDEFQASIAPFLRFFNGPVWSRNAEPGIANFAVGNPQEMPLPAYVDALNGAITPRDKDWFAYKMNEPGSRSIVARSLTSRTGLDWDPEDVFMTNGGFGALAVAFRAILDRGDEVIFLSPPWFFYELLIRAADGVPVRVRLSPPTFDIDTAAIEAAITPRTRAIILNSPHNPSGRVYPLVALQGLAASLESAAARIGQPIYLVSDEPYNRILFDDRTYHSPAEVYPNTITTYSYGKTLLAPGMRLGYIAIPPTMSGRGELRDRIFVSQVATGFAFPNADLQHAIEDIERLSIDVGALERRRDRLVPALRQMGYETTMPEGTFYVMARAPIEDDEAFAATLADRGVLVLPGSVVDLPGWMRISLTASDEMVERGLPGFAAARETAAG